MAATYSLISSNVLTSTAASVTFSSIPSTYTDLVLRFSARNDIGATQRTVQIEFNGSAGTAYSITAMSGNGASASSNRLSAQASGFDSAGQVPSGYTASTFSNVELYIPSYLASNNKAFSITSTTENNSTTSYLFATAGLWSNTAAITQVKLTSNADNFVSGSSFYLYGIKNS